MSEMTGKKVLVTGGTGGRGRWPSRPRRSEKRAVIINDQGEFQAASAFGEASDIMMAHPLALQLRNVQTLMELGVDKNTTVVFPARLMSTIGELGGYLARETAAAQAADRPEDG